MVNPFIFNNYKLGQIKHFKASKFVANTLKELQVELKRTLTTAVLIEVLETRFSCEQTELSSEIVILLLVKVMAKTVNTRVKNELQMFH